MRWNIKSKQTRGPQIVTFTIQTLKGHDPNDNMGLSVPSPLKKVYFKINRITQHTHKYLELENLCYELGFKSIICQNK